MRAQRLRCASDLRSFRYLVLCRRPGNGSTFETHVDTARSEKMFGSLVVFFPTFHKGGALHLRRRSHEWSFDSGQALAGAANDRLSIGYVALFGNVESNFPNLFSSFFTGSQGKVSSPGSKKGTLSKFSERESVC